jgi:glycosyltransferase involved in cell wall biosynthesis
VTGSAPGGATTWTFLAPGCPRPTGGDIARFELANALARRSGHAVRVVHLPHDEKQIRSLADLPWFAFDAAVEHHFPGDLDPDAIEDSDIVVYSTKLLATALAPSAGTAGPRLVDELQGDRGWLSILFLQGYDVFPPIIEELALRLPGPKVCVGSWLVALAIERGVPAADVMHVPNGVDPHRFRIIRPIESRSPWVTMNFDPFPVKGGYAGLEAIEDLHRRLAVPATVFGTLPPHRPLLDGVDFVHSPDRATLVDQVYNRASMYLQPSKQEGFGMCAVEAMACGCALVTTANGGSADYAFDGETAIVCGGEPGQMTEALGRLVKDEALRTRIAANGSRYVERFRWDSSAARLELVASERLATGRPTGDGARVDIASVARQLRAQAPCQ